MLTNKTLIYNVHKIFNLLLYSFLNAIIEGKYVKINLYFSFIIETVFSYKYRD